MTTEKIRTGGDIVSGASSLARKLGIPLKNWHLPGHKFTGPFTELEKRVDKGGNPLPGFEPYNQIDDIARQHDWCYKTADETESKTRRQCDKEMLDNLNAIKTKGIREKLDYTLVKPAIWLKYKLGLGLHDNLKLAEELHRPIKRKFKRRKVYVFNLHDIWSADLQDLSSLSKYNKGYKFLLNVIDLFSRYAYSVPLKTKSANEVTEAFEKLFDVKHPNKLWTDRGKEFVNNRIKQVLEKRNIELYHVYNEGKACVVERFNRTLGEMINRHLTAHKTNKYIDVLQNLIDEYNNKYHSTIRMSPVDANKFENRDKALQPVMHDIVFAKTQRPKYKVGDRVRIYRYKTTFEKGSKPNWTNEIFVVDDIATTKPLTYKLKDLHSEPILGSFYAQELLKTNF